ncbi:DUF6924 domain-containing protein [Amycolatopsis sp. PS_44_ISF1]|uniref:DUF6924 domain-containing protein n=1 Tax=Amycolatopsis sp. PS_44_ISF1 TaxID=2974917 RepID=UPI0028DE2B1E|nr:hypothetical protein [Amycolatopsis sp. PS_44_ISF1]MDT8912055.1 hypothetical protein [Amycolatopsis sp. PS_44_ISF1]
MTTDLPVTPCVPVIRTDFSDPEAWERLKAAIAWVTPDEFEANVSFVDDEAFTGLTAPDLLERLPDRDQHALLLIVDETTMRSPERPILIVELDADPDLDSDRPDERTTRSFRAVPHTVQNIENNLSIANMDWEDFADDVDDDGVLRVHTLYGRAEDLA